MSKTENWSGWFWGWWYSENLPYYYKVVDDYNTKMTELISQSSKVYIINAVNKSQEISKSQLWGTTVKPVDVNNCGGLLHNKVIYRF